MRTNIVIDDKLMQQAASLTKLPTKREIVETGLRMLIQIKRQELIRAVRGKLKWSGDLDSSRTDR
ncbi:MAG: type II toxin-antitoxin system VapB family antitoxin [Sterolibacterium sp.]|jgi:Arc/MetJ family transcription regulator